MNARTVARLRVHNTRLTGKPFKTPEEVVGWFGAMQSQDFGPAKWSIGQRTRSADDAALDRAYDDGTILRTHVLRPTWHFVLPADIRWMLELTGPRVHASMSSAFGQVGLDASSLKRSTRIIARALESEDRLTRREIEPILNKAGISTEGQRLAYMMSHAELNGIVCSGGLKGKQHTYALLDRRAPQAKALSHDEAVKELTLRYFTSHGPATAKDFRWWSSLPLARVREALAASSLESEDVDGVTYWFTSKAVPRRRAARVVSLLQVYDESVVAYGESRGVLDLSGLTHSLLPVMAGVFSGLVLVDDQVAGHYRRTLKKDTVTLDVTVYRRFNKAEKDALHETAHRLGAFLGRTPRVKTKAK